MKNIVIRLLSSFILFGAIFSPSSASAIDTDDLPIIRTVSFANVWLGQVGPGNGHIGIDIFKDTGSGVYNPCHNGSDPYFGACILATSGAPSYYKYEEYTPSGTTFPYGIFIDNSNNSVFSPYSSLSHYWAERISGVALEIYPHDSTGVYNTSTIQQGGARLTVSSWPTNANGGVYTPNLGNITLPEYGGSNVGKLNGFISKGGSTVGANAATIDMFQWVVGAYTSTGWPVLGFASMPTNGDGYYTSGPLFLGEYRTYITDNSDGRKIYVRTDVYTPYDRIDINLSASCFGFSSCHCPNLAGESCSGYGW